MMLDNGGCDGRSPGIGDIAYVKDLRTEKIVSITFRCSIFGGYHPEYFQMGWVCCQKIIFIYRERAEF